MSLVGVSVKAEGPRWALLQERRVLHRALEQVPWAGRTVAPSTSPVSLLRWVWAGEPSGRSGEAQTGSSLESFLPSRQHRRSSEERKAGEYCHSSNMMAPTSVGRKQRRSPGKSSSGLGISASTLALPLLTR